METNYFWYTYIFMWTYRYIYRLFKWSSSRSSNNWKCKKRGNIFNFIFYLKEDISFSKENLIKVIKFIIGYFITVYIIDYLFKFDYNMIDTFINMDIFIINYLRNYGLIISYFIMIITIIFLLILASFILLKKNK